MSFGFAAVAVHRVTKPFRRGELEMDRLARKRPETRREEEQPREQLGAIVRRAEELAGLLGEIDEYGKNRRRELPDRRGRRCQ